MKYQLREEPEDFLTTAPHRRTWTRDLAASPERVYAAISAEPGTWRSWFPGLTAGRWLEDGGEPGAAGARREVTLWGRVRIAETIIVWDEPHRWAYRLDGCTVPMAKALIEEWKVEPHGTGSRVSWTFAGDAALPIALSVKYAPVFVGSTFHRAMRALDKHLATEGTSAV